MSYSKQTVELFKEWLRSDVDAAKEEDPSVGIFRDDELAGLLEHAIANIDDWLEREKLINSPELEQFLRGTHIEAVHQVERWGVAHDRAKRPADWFWLVGYLAGKALHAAIGGDIDKARHHCISTAAALYNWHCAIAGRDVRMCPGRSDVAEIVDRAFPGEAPPP